MRFVHIAGMLAVVGCASCRCSGPAGDADPKAIAAAAVAAHGGRENLAKLDHVLFRGTARFKERVAMRGEVHFEAPSTFAVELRVVGGPTMRFGLDGDHCWRQDRELVAACTDSDLREHRRFLELVRARVLQGFETRTWSLEPAARLGGRAAPALRDGEALMVFDPDTHRLAEIRVGDEVDAFSEFRAVGGALVAARRTKTVAARPDVDEVLDEIVPGGADPARLHPPDMKDGVAVDDVDVERPVAWTEVTDLEGDAVRAVRELDARARARGLAVSASDGVVFTALDAAPGRFRMAITLELGTPVPPADEGAVHLETWPETRVVGAFHRGDPRSLAARELVEHEIQRRGVVQAPGARWQILCRREELARPLADRLSLVRVAVEPRAPSQPVGK